MHRLSCIDATLSPQSNDFVYDKEVFTFLVGQCTRYFQCKEDIEMALSACRQSILVTQIVRVETS